MLRADEKHIAENMGREGQLWRHGVRRNDKLLEVDDRNVDGMVGLSERNLILRQNVNKDVFLRFLRAQVWYAPCACACETSTNGSNAS